jgi:hypothetical protein
MVRRAAAMSLRWMGSPERLASVRGIGLVDRGGAACHGRAWLGVGCLGRHVVDRASDDALGWQLLELRTSRSFEANWHAECGAGHCLRQSSARHSGWGLRAGPCRDCFERAALEGLSVSRLCDFDLWHLPGITLEPLTRAELKRDQMMMSIRRRFSLKKIQSVLLGRHRSPKMLTRQCTQVSDFCENGGGRR